MNLSREKIAVYLKINKKSQFVQQLHNATPDVFWWYVSQKLKWLNFYQFTMYDVQENIFILKIQDI